MSSFLIVKILTMNSAERIFINTIAQYVKTVISMILGLFSTRLVLQILGINDYGVFSLVAGVVTLLGFFTSSLASATQRFLSYYQGTKDINQIRELFSNCLLLHIIIGVFVVIGLECIGPFLFHGFLNIDPSRIWAAQVLFQVVILNLLVSFLTAPFTALVISHENIVFTSIVGISDAVLKLVFVLLLNYISYDKLIVYGSSILLIHVIDLVAQAVYCKISYKECSIFNFSSINKGFLKDFSSFTGWSIYNTGCNIGRTQGVAIILNKFYGTAVNAAYGISASVVSYVSVISQSLINAISPQIMKMEGGGNRERMLWLCALESKVAFFLLSALSIPVMFEINSLLTIWLGKVPRYAGLLCCMGLITTLADMTTTGLSLANYAMGKLKNFSLYVYSIKLLTIPFAIACLYIYNSIISLVVIYIIVEIIEATVRLPFMKKNGGISILDYIKRVHFKLILPTLIIVFICWITTLLFSFSGRILITFIMAFIAYLPSVYLFGLTSEEKILTNKLLFNIKSRFSKK